MEMRENSRKIKTGSLCLYWGLYVLVLERIEQTNTNGFLHRDPDKFVVLFPSNTVDIVSEASLVLNQL